MAVGIPDRLWSVDDTVALIDPAEIEPRKRGRHRRRHTALDFKVSLHLSLARLVTRALSRDELFLSRSAGGDDDRGIGARAGAPRQQGYAGISLGVASARGL